MAVYKKAKNDTTYFSTKEGKPDEAKLKALEKIKIDMDVEIYDAMRSKYYAEAQDGDPVGSSFDMLTTITKTYEHLSPLAKESMDARQTMAVVILNDEPADLTNDDLAETDEKKRYVDPLDKHLHLVREAAGTSWSNLRGWCDEVDPKTNKKTGKYLVKNPVLSALDKKVKGVQDEAARKNAVAAANKAAKASEAA